MERERGREKKKEGGRKTDIDSDGSDTHQSNKLVPVSMRYCLDLKLGSKKTKILDIEHKELKKFFVVISQTL